MSETNSHRRPWLIVLCVVMIFYSRAGLTVTSAITGFIFLGFAGAFHLIMKRSRRPRRSFYQLALASTLLLVFLMHASWHGELMLAAITWLVVTGLASMVIVNLERTGPAD